MATGLAAGCFQKSAMKSGLNHRSSFKNSSWLKPHGFLMQKSQLCKFVTPYCAKTPSQGACPRGKKISVAFPMKKCEEEMLISSGCPLYSEFDYFHLMFSNVYCLMWIHCLIKLTRRKGASGETFGLIFQHMRIWEQFEKRTLMPKVNIKWGPFQPSLHHFYVNCFLTFLRMHLASHEKLFALGVKFSYRLACSNLGTCVKNFP